MTSFYKSRHNWSQILKDTDQTELEWWNYLLVLNNPINQVPAEMGSLNQNLSSDKRDHFDVRVEDVCAYALGNGTTVPRRTRIQTWGSLVLSVYHTMRFQTNKPDKWLCSVLYLFSKWEGNLLLQAPKDIPHLPGSQRETVKSRASFFCTYSKRTALINSSQGSRKVQWKHSSHC